MKKIKNNYEDYWLHKAKILEWEKVPKKSVSRKKTSIHWYSDGKINIFKNCILKNIKNGFKNKTAIIFLDENKKVKRFTYNEILFEINRFCTFLKNIRSKNNITKIMLHASASIDTSL